MPPGHLFIICAPSGAGKTSLVKALVESTDNIQVSVSHTTRSPRPGEIDGKNYNFVDQATFAQMLSQAEFLEHAEVFGNYYGTSQRWVEETLATGTDVILEIDWQGAQQVKRQFKSLSHIFIAPPSVEVLRERLNSRGQDDEDVIAKRMAEALDETSHYIEADYFIVNDDFELALGHLRSIVLNQRLRLEQQCIRQAGLLKALLSPQ